MERELTIEELAEIVVLEKRLESVRANVEALRKLLEGMEYEVEVVTCQLQLAKDRPVLEMAEQQKRTTGRLL